MPDDFEGALNEQADVPPTVSKHESLHVDTVDDAGEFDHETVTDVGDDATADEEEADRSLNEARDEPASRGPIPYERFREVNEKAQLLEEQARYLQEQQQLLSRAASLGLPSVDALNTADNWARANGFPTAEALQAHLNEQRQLAEYAQQISQRTDLSDQARQELIAARAQQVQITQQMKALNQQVRYVQSQNVEQAIERAKQELGTLDPDLEHLFRHSTPQIVRQATGALKRQLEQTVDNRIAEYAVKKRRTQSTTPPEGKGGNAPAPAAGSRNGWKKSTFADLIFGPGRMG